MTPAEAVVMDWLLERGYTREQAARALVALTLPEPKTERLMAFGRVGYTLSQAARLLLAGTLHDDPGLETNIIVLASHESWFASELRHEAERRGYLPREGT